MSRFPSIHPSIRSSIHPVRPSVPSSSPSVHPTITISWWQSVCPSVYPVLFKCCWEARFSTLYMMTIGQARRAFESGGRNLAATGRRSRINRLLKRSVFLKQWNYSKYFCMNGIDWKAIFSILNSIVTAHSSIVFSRFSALVEFNLKLKLNWNWIYSFKENKKMFHENGRW